MLLNRFAAILVILAVCTSMFAQTKPFDTARMDTGTLACDNFFQYVNGTWLKNTEIPADRSSTGSFQLLGDRNTDVLHDILENAAKTKSPKGSDLQMIGDFYATCMDEARLEAYGLKGLKPWFKKIGKIKDGKGVMKTVAGFHKAGIPAIFNFGASPDLNKSTMNIANTGQGGLSLPNKEYYTKDDDKSKETRDKFVAHMTKMFTLAGDAPDKAAANAQTVMKLQMRLANASRTPVENRNPKLSDNKMTLADASKLAPNVGWETYIVERGAPAVTDINVSNPTFLKEVNAMLSDVPAEEWKAYLRWNALNSAAPALPKAFADENFDFFGRTMSGAKEQQPRWRRCVNATDNTLGEALGMQYVKTNYTPEAKKRMDELIDNLMAALHDRIMHLEWMGDDTKKQATEKLAAFGRKIGYPDKLRGYAGLSISRKSHLQNLLATSQFQIARNLKDIGQPVDRSRWGFTPPTVNASYSPQFNMITFPAGILQPPFFNFSADDAVNYGAIGGVIGHEISHGFDDQGSQFDAVGNLRMWWTPEDRKNFEERANCVVEQFNGFDVGQNLKINGKLTLGENIGDLGGLNIAYDAYQRSLKGKPKPADIDGFTADQRFFLGWAQVWGSKMRDEAIRQQVLGNPHADARFRVIGPLMNMPEFAQAFGCKLPDKMVSPKPCKIW
ncbi:MAG TPA: M13 family metallopeptidase [Pyrinomonadaceae bacterium]|jgi:putative endopeptidase|nr:M13 family metallopeptidase [Pyrinomonadaceae bacterium]